MPYVFKPNKLYVKNPEGSGFLPQNIITDQTTEEMIAQVEAAGASTISEVQQAVSDSQNAVAGIDAQRDTIIASIASVAGQGTDTTLTQSGVAADAKAAGDTISDLKSELEAFEAGENEIQLDVGSIQENYVSYSNGKINTSSSSFGHVGYIDISRFTKIKYSRIKTTGSSDIMGLAFYTGTGGSSDFIADSGIKALRHQSSVGYELTEVTVPETAKYVAFSAILDTQTYGTPQLIGVIENEVLEDIAELKSAFNGDMELNACNLLARNTYTDYSDRGITINWHGGYGYAAGTATGSALGAFIGAGVVEMPYGIVPGGKYTLRHNNSKIKVRCVVYKNGGTSTTLISDTATDVTFTVPTDAVGLRFTSVVSSGVNVDGEVIHPMIVSAPTNAELAAALGGYVGYAAQSKTDAEKAQARENIGAADADDLETVTGDLEDLNDVVNDNVEKLNLMTANADDEIEYNGITVETLEQNKIRVVSDGVRESAAVNFYASIFNGHHFAQKTGTPATKWLKAGTYTLKWDVELPTGLAFYYSTTAVQSENKVKIVSGTPFALAADGYVYLTILRTFSDTTGVEISFALYEGESDAAFPIFGETATAVDVVARDRSAGWLAGKTIMFFGDSIIGSFLPPTDIPTYVKKYTGANVINVGFGGSRMQDIGSNDVRHMLSMYRLAESIGLGDFTQQYESLLNEYLPSQGQTDYNFAKSKVDKIAAQDFTKVDIIVLEHGTNDATYGAPVTGLNSNNCPAYKPSLEYVIETIQGLYPNVRIVLCTPIYRKLFVNSNLDSNEYHYTNSLGQDVYFHEYGDAMKEVAEKYNLLLIDNYNIGINVYTHSYYLRDSVHPNERGRELMARHIAQHLI